MDNTTSVVEKIHQTLRDHAKMLKDFSKGALCCLVRCALAWVIIFYMVVALN